MNETFWRPGSIVKLQSPYKPSDPPKGLLKAIAGTGSEYHQMIQYEHHWQGFTHGVIVQAYAYDHQGKVSGVSLHLYDPERCVVYVEDGQHGIPTYVDFSVDELTPIKDGAVVGYEVISEG